MSLNKLDNQEIQFLIDIVEEKRRGTRYNGGADYKTENTLTHTSGMYFIILKLEKLLN